jgi:short-subunit dehydrogenase
MGRRDKSSLLASAVGLGTLLVARELIKRAREYDLRGKIVLITGGSRGLGLEMAREFASQGALLAICARDSEELQRAQSELSQNGAQVIAIRCDVTDFSQVTEMVRIIRERLGRIDVLVNNAGAIEVGPMEVMTLDDYKEAMNIHFWGPLYTTLAVLPEMRDRHEGHIVNISSIGGKVSVPHLLPYSASKFALVGLSEGLRAELTKDGIVVTTVCPGLMRTGSPGNAIFKGKHRAEYTWFSISDSLPLTSINSRRAAKQIVSACKRGEAEVVLTIQAKIADTFHALFPGLTSDLMSIVNRLLPGPGGIGTDRAKGKESHSALSPSILTTLSDQAAKNNNEAA